MWQTIRFSVPFLISKIFASIAVPLFFFISGYLFFGKTNGFGQQDYINKMKKRARSILIPYLFWNLLIILLYLFIEQLTPGLFSGRNKPVSDYTWSDWLWAFWDMKHINSGGDSMPINYPFWFIRDLMVVMFFSPLVYFLLKRLKQYAVLSLGVLWFTGCWFPVVGFSIIALFFFSAGAYLGIFKKDFTETAKAHADILAIAYTLFAIVILTFRETGWVIYIHNLSILIGMVVAIGGCARFLEQGCWRVNRFLSEGSFFIYAAHAMPLAFVIKACFKLIQPQSEGSLLFLYLFCPAITISVCLAAYYLLNRYLPRFTAIITGGR